MKLGRYYFLVLLVGLLTACNFTKFVPEGEYLLDKVKIESDSKTIPESELEKYLRQTPNARAFKFFRPQLAVYNLSGKDSTNWFNKLLKRIGEEPVIYSQELTQRSVQQLQQELENKGYVNARVDSKVNTNEKKATVVYTLKFNQPYTLRNYNFDLSNTDLAFISKDSTRSLIRKGMLFDVDILNAERERISTRYRQQGHFKFSKEALAYVADSSLNSHNVDLTIELKDEFKPTSDDYKSEIYKRYYIGKVFFHSSSDSNTPSNSENSLKQDTVQFRDFYLISENKMHIKLDALVQNTYINPQSLYSDRAIERTYAALNSLGPIKYVNISFTEVQDSLIDCHIMITPDKAFTISSEVEYTYTNGYSGVAGNLNTSHQNVFRGAEILSLQARIALEWQNGVVAQEWGGRAGLKFPKFVFPIGSYDFKRDIHANTEFTTSINYQHRPDEYKTTNVGAGMNYSWNNRQYTHNVQFLDLSYVHFPWISEKFKERFLGTVSGTLPVFNPYNYRDHFIMRMGYNGSFTNASNSHLLRNFSSIRYSFELAGNLIYAANKLLGSKVESDGSYRFLGIRYSQFAKSEFVYTYNQIFDRSNRIVYRVGAGIGIPYGNADAIPYEKRFFSGGANSVRGWSESTLGPGTYERISNQSRDYNQVGDLKLDLNMEYRAKLFWIMEGALFVDAGNIWTIKDYETQKNGTFHLDTFAKQIAIAYGTGFRLDFSFFILRFDIGIKLHNPVLATDNWRLKPQSQDLAFHIGIGYPF